MSIFYFSYHLDAPKQNLSSSLYIVDPRGLEPLHFRLRGGYSTIELRIPILRIHLGHHCNEIIAITTVGYTIPIRAPCIHNIISMDTRHPLPVMSGFPHNAFQTDNPLHSIRMRRSIPKAPSLFRHNPPQIYLFAPNEKRIHVSRARE